MQLVVITYMHKVNKFGRGNRTLEYIIFPKSGWPLHIVADEDAVQKRRIVSPAATSRSLELLVTEYRASAFYPHAEY